jgi:uncharacterized membrane protein
MPQPPKRQKYSPELSGQQLPEVTQFTSKFYQGVIPSPEMMEEYQRIDPEIPRKILEWTEAEGNHRRKLERKFAMHAFLTTIWGYIFAFFSLALILVLAWLFMDRSYATEGAAIVGAVAIGITGVFIIRKWKSEDKQ